MSEKQDVAIGNGYALRAAEHGGGCHLVRDGRILRGDNRQPLWFASISKAVQFAVADWEVQHWEARRDEALQP